MTRLSRWLLAMAAPLLLVGCILTPTKFASTLDIHADRSFTYTYVGEVQLARTEPRPMFDENDDAGDDQSWERDDENGEPLLYKIAATTGPWRRASDAAAPVAAPGDINDFDDTDEEARQLKALAQALAREYGFRSVKYVGHRSLAIDYAISGTLDHAFIFPFHPDGDVVLPFIAIELRGKDRVRIKAPGFANEPSLRASALGMGGMPADGPDMTRLDGTFTLTTDAEIVSQNQEDGATSGPDGTRSVVWRATPQTRDAPMAVLRLKPLP